MSKKSIQLYWHFLLNLAKNEIFLGLFWSFLTRQNLFKRLLEFTQNWLCLSNDTKDTIVWWALKDVHDRVVYIGEI